MGRYLFRLPDLGEGVTEAEIVQWRIRPGEPVREDQCLVDVMTDKATIDVTSPVEGVVTAIHGEAGLMRPVGSVLVEFRVEGPGNADDGPAPEPVGAAPDHAAPEAAAPTAEAAPLAAPATRRRADEHGIDLRDVPGRGPGGRITPEDLDAFIAENGAPAAADARPRVREGVTETRITGLRRRIAEKMQEAKRHIPHFSYIEECDVTELEALRATLNAHRSPDRPKLTLLPFLMRALVRILPEFPHVNARYDDETGILHSFAGIHIGIATQTPDGLMVPVVRHAEARDLWDCARELARVAGAARDGNAGRADLVGSTITLTSLGALGGVAATPVINHPEVAIIGPNKLIDRPVVRNGQVVVRTMMNISASFDHRIVDGADAARFIQAMKRLIEHPALIFID